MGSWASDAEVVAPEQEAEIIAGERPADRRRARSDGQLAGSCHTETG